MRSFSELAGRDLVWQSDGDTTIPATADQHFALYDGQQQVATAHVTWTRLAFFDVAMESGDGTYQAHLDLARNDRPGVAWRPGDAYSLAGFVVTNEGLVTCGGLISTHSGRQLLLEPTRQIGYEYAIFPAGGARILTLAASLHGGFGGNPGHMSIEPPSATDVELPALVALALAVANEQVRLLHRAG